MKTVDYVRIIRVRANVLSRRSRTGLMGGETFRPIPGSWLEGHLIKPIRVGQEFLVECTCLNGKICVCGRVYVSTTVIRIQRDYVFTQDEQFKVLRVPRFDPEKSLRAWQ